MTLAALSLVFEGLVSVLLVAVIVYAVKLNGRIVALRSQESGLKEMIAQFNEAATQAEVSASHLTAAGMDSERNLRTTIERAQAMRDDLSFLIERGGNVSSRMERSNKFSGDRSPARDRTPARDRSPAPAFEPAKNAFESPMDEPDDRNVLEDAERAVEDLVDRFADQAEPSLWRAAARDMPENPSKSGGDRQNFGNDNLGADSNLWFGDSSEPLPEPVDPPTNVDPRVSNWTPGAKLAAVELPTEAALEAPLEASFEAPLEASFEERLEARLENPEITSRSEAERELLKALRTSGVRS